MDNNLDKAYEQFSENHEQLRKEMLGSLAGRKAKRRTHIFIRSKIIKLAVAAVIIIAISLFIQFGQDSESLDKTEPITYFSLLSKARAAEQTLFEQDGIVHIVNEIIVYPVSANYKLPERIDPQNLSSQQRDYLRTVNSWLDYNWLPLCSLKADGELRFNQLKLSENADESYIITDQAWYDPTTGYFARVMEVDEKVIFANSYDGQSVYFSETGPDSSVEILSQRVTDDFIPPQNPAEFLGISSGVRSSVQKDVSLPIREVTEDILEDGSVVDVYKIGYADLLGDLNTYWLFKIRRNDGIAAEMEFVISGSTQLVVRRVLSETINSAALSWNLNEIDHRLASGADLKATIIPDMMIPNISLEYMINKAGFETYVFSHAPSWTDNVEIGDVADFASSSRRMFIITYQATDGRHVVFCQSHSFNKFFPSILKMGRLLWTSPNGFKLWHGGPYKWWTEMHMRSCGFKPAEDRIGYVIETPSGTFPSLAINGPVTEEELHSLIDSLVPAKEYIQLKKGDPNE